ncbi:MAG: tetratricopeptide repeat protein, partial [Candidatus Limnocylindrales bacterium]
VGRVHPTTVAHVSGDRGLLLGLMGRFGAAIAALRTYVDERPDAQDASDVRQVTGIFAGRRNEPVPLGANHVRQAGAPTRGL